MSEIVLIIGSQAAGKTTLTEKYQGYCRVNRDTLGRRCRLYKLPIHVEKHIKNGETKFVLDNTYKDVESRKGIIELAKKYGFEIKCVWLNTSFEDAQFNACTRMVRKYGKLLTPEEINQVRKKNPNIFQSIVLWDYQEKFQKPTLEEGFDSIEIIEFNRVKDPAYCNKALILDYDGTIRYTQNTQYDFPTKPHEVKILPNRKEKLHEYKNQGYLVLGVSNQSAIARQYAPEEDIIACFKRTNELLELDIDYLYCPHNNPPITCYCRKPQCGNLVVHIEKYKLDTSKCLFIGDQISDKTAAERCNIEFRWAKDFFNDTTN